MGFKEWEESDLTEGICKKQFPIKKTGESKTNKNKNTTSDCFNKKSCLYKVKAIHCKASGIRSKSQDEANGRGT